MASRRALRPSTNHVSQACDCCRIPVPVSEPGWVILGNRRLICVACYDQGLFRCKPKAFEPISDEVPA